MLYITINYSMICLSHLQAIPSLPVTPSQAATCHATTCSNSLCAPGRLLCWLGHLLASICGSLRTLCIILDPFCQKSLLFFNPGLLPNEDSVCCKVLLTAGAKVRAPMCEHEASRFHPPT